jgi:hypothetical protein
VSSDFESGGHGRQRAEGETIRYELCREAEARSVLRGVQHAEPV